MEIDLIKLLTDVGGYAGVGIVLVVVFLNYLTKRDKEYCDERKTRDEQWQNFFTMLNAGNKEDTKALTDAMTKLTDAVTDSFRGIARDLADHDKRVDDRISAAQNIATAQRRNRPTGAK